MKTCTQPIEFERSHHDKVASFYELRSRTDYIWEIPTEILLFRKGYIKDGYQIVDMGCGPSTIIRHLIPLSRLKKIKYTGVDISKEMLKFAKKNIPSGKFVIGDMSTVELPKESADIIVSLGGLHHSVDKDKTLSHWLQLLKSDGIIMLREPTYEAFKAGKGESPMEEGIKMSELVSFVKEYNLVLESITYFNTGAFHLFNRILIKLGLKGWQKIRSLWYPVIYVDIFLSKYLGFIPYCKGLAFAAIIRKQYVK